MLPSSFKRHWALQVPSFQKIRCIGIIGVIGVNGVNGVNGVIEVNGVIGVNEVTGLNSGISSTLGPNNKKKNSTLLLTGFFRGKPVKTAQNGCKIEGHQLLPRIPSKDSCSWGAMSNGLLMLIIKMSDKVFFLFPPFAADRTCGPDEWTCKSKDQCIPGLATNTILFCLLFVKKNIDLLGGKIKDPP